MLTRIKTYLLIAIAGGAFYFLLSHHIVFTSFTDFDLLKKEELTLKYTFFSLKQANPYQVLKIEPLRNAGIEEIMLERGLVSEAKLETLLQQIDQSK